MRILCATFGSLGDLHPFIALGLELKSRGHDVAVVTSPYHRDRIGAAGLGFFPAAPDLRPDDQQLIRATLDERRGPEAVFRFMANALPRTYADYQAAADGFAPDLLLTSELAYAGSLLAAARGLRWASVTLSPISFLSRYELNLIPQAPWLMRGAFALGTTAYGAVLTGLKRLSRRLAEPINRFRAEIGLPRVAEPLFADKHSPDLNLALFSTLMGGPYPDWPSHTVVSGYAFYDGGDAPLGPELEAFLDAGDPPVVFTLGSAAVFDPGAFYDESVKAAAAIGCRALLLVGPEPQQAPRASRDVGVFDYGPYSRLFPRAAAIVHQGGSGTTGQALRAGRPMVVVPYAHDQPDNADHVRRLGVSQTIGRNAYSASAAAAALDRVLGDPAFADRAADAASVVASEPGAAGAARAIELTFWV